MTVNCTSAQRGEGDALECSPDVAKWLHDEVVQRLSSVVAALAPDGMLARDDRARCHAELEGALRALGLLLDDRAEQQRRRRFRTVVEAVRATSAMPEGCTVELRIHGDAEVSPSTGEFLADFVTETLRNVVKHAQARSVVLTVSVSEHAVRVEVFNDGVMPASRGRGAGLGLRLLAARARDHDGFVSSRPKDPDGWSTTAILIRSSHKRADGPDASTGVRS